MKKKTKKAKFLAAYDERGNYICDYMVVKMGKGKSAVLPITKRMKAYYRKLLGPWMEGERKVIWRGWMAEKMRNMSGGVFRQSQEDGFYRLMRPLIEGGRRGKQVEVLKRIGALKSPKTL